MVWDLRAALLKKEEKESARLADFDFRQRTRTFRLMGDALGLAPTEAQRLVVRGDDLSLLEELRRRFPARADEVDELYRACRTLARKQLIAEIGDPAPYRLL